MARRHRTYRRDARGRFASSGGGSVRKRYHSARARRLGRKIRERQASGAHAREVANLTVRRDTHRRKSGARMPVWSEAHARRDWAHRVAVGERRATRVERRLARAERAVAAARTESERARAQRAAIRRVFGGRR